MQILCMVLQCPKCARTMPDDSVYCPYCGHGVKPSARTTQVSAGSTLIIVSAVACLILFTLSIRALADIYSWYPPLVAQSWIIYDQMLAIFLFTGFLFGLSASVLSMARRSYMWAMASAVLCTLSSAVAWIISIIIPFSSWGYSLLYFFLPCLVPSLVGTMLILPRRAEFKQ